VSAVWRRLGCRAAVALAPLGLALSLSGPVHALPQQASGRVRDAGGEPIVGAMVTFRQGSPFHETTVFSDANGRYAGVALDSDLPFSVRVRRIGWRDQRLQDQPPPSSNPSTRATVDLDFVLERETDAVALAAQLPANRWYALLLESLDDAGQREEFVRQCTYCHQQGSWATRRQRGADEWQKVLSLMARMGGILSPELRARVPELFSRAYAPATAVPRLTERMGRPDFAPPPGPEVRRAAIEEWELGHPASMQHDLTVHPDGRIYSVDMTQDKLYRLDASNGSRADFALPHGDLQLGGVLGGAGAPLPPNANSYVGPHSLQIAPDGSVWATLALGNQLARFDTQSERWEIHELDEGIYPHTLRFDQLGRIWYTMAVSNHVGMLDPASGEQHSIRLPSSSFGQAVALRLIPVMLWLGKFVDLGAMAAGEGGSVSMPIPYGIDVAPDGGIWFSQLNEHHIGRIDPDDFSVEMIETPFSAPRRLRFDSKGRLWIPGFSSGLISRFDLATRSFESYPIPIEPLGSETPYALNVDRRNDTVWICGTNSDSLIRFEPESERFTVYPLPTRVTYTRELEFDEEGRVWTSNSNLPAWQIEGGMPRVLRLDPDFSLSREADHLATAIESGGL
jgi:streptogramin lyase